MEIHNHRFTFYHWFTEPCFIMYASHRDKMSWYGDLRFILRFLFLIIKKYYLLVTAFQYETFRNILLYHDQGIKKMSWAFWLLPWFNSCEKQPENCRHNEEQNRSTHFTYISFRTIKFGTAIFSWACFQIDIPYPQQFPQSRRPFLIASCVCQTVQIGRLVYKQPFWTSHTHTLRGRSKWRWLRLQSQPHRTRELTHRVNRTAYAHTRARTSCTTLNTIIRRACVRACWQMPANCPALNTSDAVWSPPCLGDNILTTIAAISHVHEHAHTGG